MVLGTSVRAGAAAASLVAKTGPGTLHSLQCNNGAGAANFICIFDATSLPGNGTNPAIAPIAVPVSSSAFINFDPGIDFVNGIVIAKSTTAPTITLGANDGFISCGYK